VNAIAVIGEAVADIFAKPRTAARLEFAEPRTTGPLELDARPGGGPVNVAVALGRLGSPTRFFGRLAAGPLGDLIRDHLTGSRVELTGSVTAAEPATLALTSLDAAGRATYEFYAEGTADWQWSPAELAPSRFAGVGCVHTGSMALIKEPGGPVIEELLAGLRTQATISIDPNVRPRFVPPAAYRAPLERWASQADILRLSDEDFALLYPGDDRERVFDRWHAAGVGLAIVTLGPDGAYASLHGTRVAVPAPKVVVADTVGAGDAFTAGLLHWLGRAGRLGGRLEALTVAELTAAMEFAVRIAARTCEVPGADPPWAEPGEVPLPDGPSAQPLGGA
jgi:fructokinase